MIQEDRIEKLKIRQYESRALLGEDAARVVAEKIRQLLAGEDEQLVTGDEQLAAGGDVNIIFAAAPSQNEFLASLVREKAVDWTRVNAFHMDEYIGLPPEAPQGFGNFLKERIFEKLPFKSVHYIQGNTADPEAECERYEDLLKSFPVHLVCMGIGENNHIAFNDPHVADFNDSRRVKVVELDQACRQQQVNDECFEHIGQVPVKAITLTIPALMDAKSVFCVAPGQNKARAVYHTFQQEISERYPSTILRNHPDALLFLDRDSSVLLR